MKNHSYTAVSLFSGAGGMDVGFKKAGFDVVWANDLNFDACQTYEANLGSHIVCGDINSHFYDLKKFSNVDLIFGGPPCQGFSVAGKMDPNDARSKLIWSFVKSVDIIRPKAFVMENVKSLATLGRFRYVRKSLISEFIKLGYEIDLVVLNSKNYGVPQSRERMFLVGCYGEKRKFNFIKSSEQYQSAGKTVKEIMQPLGKAGSEGNSRVCKAKITIAAKPVLRKSPYAGMLFNGQGRPIDPNSFSCTLHASMGGNRTPLIDEQHLFDDAPSWVEAYHSHLIRGGDPYPMDAAPDFLRRLTVDECLRLQTFPDDFKFIGRQSSVFKQIGNAVPCDLAAGVAYTVADLLNGNYQEKLSSQLYLEFDQMLAMS